MGYAMPPEPAAVNDTRTDGVDPGNTAVVGAMLHVGSPMATWGGDASDHVVANPAALDAAT